MRRPRNLVQLAMESPLVAQIYESWLWRRSPLLQAALGISFANEQGLVLGAAHLRGGETVLDLGCGTGIYTRPLARLVGNGRALGLDLSSPMLRHAATRARGLPNLWLIRGDALRLPLPDACVDVVTCCAAFHVFPDVTTVVTEVARVLKPGGRFIASVFRRQPGWLADLTAELRHYAGTRGFTLEELRARLHAGGLDEIQAHHARAGWLVVSSVKPR